MNCKVSTGSSDAQRAVVTSGPRQIMTAIDPFRVVIMRILQGRVCSLRHFLLFEQRLSQCEELRPFQKGAQLRSGCLNKHPPDSTGSPRQTIPANVTFIFDGIYSSSADFHLHHPYPLPHPHSQNPPPSSPPSSSSPSSPQPSSTPPHTPPQAISPTPPPQAPLTNYSYNYPPSQSPQIPTASVPSWDSASCLYFVVAR